MIPSNEDVGAETDTKPDQTQVAGVQNTTATEQGPEAPSGPEVQEEAQPVYEVRDIKMTETDLRRATLSVAARIKNQYPGLMALRNGYVGMMQKEITAWDDLAVTSDEWEHLGKRRDILEKLAIYGIVALTGLRILEEDIESQRIQQEKDRSDLAMRERVDRELKEAADRQADKALHTDTFSFAGNRYRIEAHRMRFNGSSIVFTSDTTAEVRSYTIAEAVANGFIKEIIDVPDLMSGIGTPFFAKSHGSNVTSSYTILDEFLFWDRTKEELYRRVNENGVLQSYTIEQARREELLDVTRPQAMFTAARGKGTIYQYKNDRYRIASEYIESYGYYLRNTNTNKNFSTKQALRFGWIERVEFAATRQSGFESERPASTPLLGFENRLPYRPGETPLVASGKSEASGSTSGVVGERIFVMDGITYRIKSPFATWDGNFVNIVVNGTHQRLVGHRDALKQGVIEILRGRDVSGPPAAASVPNVNVTTTNSPEVRTDSTMAPVVPPAHHDFDCGHI
jgi:hypothetical protein